jgi:hypothetical protein
VAGGDPVEVLWLGRGYVVVRHEPIWKRRRDAKLTEEGNGLRVLKL